jgi:hypothetical protein
VLVKFCIKQYEIEVMPFFQGVKIQGKRRLITLLNHDPYAESYHHHVKCTLWFKRRWQNSAVRKSGLEATTSSQTYQQNPPSVCIVVLHSCLINDLVGIIILMFLSFPCGYTGDAAERESEAVEHNHEVEQRH